MPAWFLRSSLHLPYERVEVLSDRGMVQRGPFHADLDATTHAVADLMDGLEAAADALAPRLRSTGCDVVICDIDPLGIAVAERLGVPSVLVENFRWDWIYAELPEASAALRDGAARMGAVYRRAGLHVQIAPACDRVERAVQVERPVARRARAKRAEARAGLGIGPRERVILVTTGGIRSEPAALDPFSARPDVTFVVTGADRSGRSDNVIRFEHDEPLYLPDLLRASDGVVAKVGYSTLAEAWREGRPVMRVPRHVWPEGPVLTAWAERHVGGFEVDEADFTAGRWIARIDELLALPHGAPRDYAGEDELAEKILSFLG